MARRTHAERIREAEDRVARARARVSELHQRERALVRKREKRMALALGPKLLELAKREDEEALALIGRLASECSEAQRADIQETLPLLELPPPNEATEETTDRPATNAPPAVTETDQYSPESVDVRNEWP